MTERDELLELTGVSTLGRNAGKIFEITVMFILPSVFALTGLALLLTQNMPSLCINKTRREGMLDLSHKHAPNMKEPITMEKTAENYSTYKNSADNYIAVHVSKGYTTEPVDAETASRLWLAVKDATPAGESVSIAEWEVGVYNPFGEKLDSFNLADMELGFLSFNQLAKLISASPSPR